MIPLAHSTQWLSGFIPDLPTPLNDRGEIDADAFGRLCRRQIAAGATALVVGETAGECATLEPAEREQLVRIAAGIARGRARIIAGAGSNATDRAVAFAQAAEAAGADAVISVVPYYNKPMAAGMTAHFRAVAAATRLPVILHDIPSRTVKGLPDETLLALAASPRFIGLRDGSGDIARLMRLRLQLPPGFRLLTGDDTTSLASARRRRPWLHLVGRKCRARSVRGRAPAPPRGSAYAGARPALGGCCRSPRCWSASIPPP